MSEQMIQEQFMRRAIELAKQGVGWTNPNPMVGAVIVKDGRIIAEGYHHRCGELHAERTAIANLKESAQNATIYVTLEPCCHYGRTPPCTEAILEQGISHVVIGSRDPNPLVAGKGAEMLRAHGVKVTEDFLRDECDELNPVFFHYITTGMPYVVMKYAMTLDGKIACHTGDSKWITGEAARNHVQTLRGRYSGILAGIGTVLADNPMLNCRIPGAHNPLRIIVDSNLRIPLDTQLVQSAKEFPLLVAGVTGDPAKIKALEEAGVKVLLLPEEEGASQEKIGQYLEGAELLRTDNRRSYGNAHVDLKKLMEHLGKMKIDSVLIEGGGEVHEAALKAGIVNHVCAYVAPKLFGGRDAKTPVEGQGVPTPADGALLKLEKIQQLGDDLLLEYGVIKQMT